VVRMFMSDQDSVEVIEGLFDGGKPRQRVAFAKTGVYQEPGAFGFEQRQIARTSRRQYGYA